MKKRSLCFLTAVVFLLFLSFPALACDHCDEDGEPYKYVRRGQVEPQIGITGFTGDLCCPECGDVIIPGEIIPALEESAGPGSGESGEADQPEKREEQVQQEEHEQQEDPAEPEDPSQPETPVSPEEPIQPETPETPEEPVSPEEPAQPETPVSPEEPVQPETPVTPEEPVQPETPVTPEEPIPQDDPMQPEERIQQEDPEMPAILPQEESKGEDKPKTPAEKQEDGSSRSSGTEGPDQRGFSGKFPYRRVKMQPAEGIWAEGAGVLIWPATASPFQSIFGE